MERYVCVMAALKKTQRNVHLLVKSPFQIFPLFFSVLKVSWIRNVSLMSSFRPKQQQKYCKDSCPSGLYSFFGASLKLFGTSCKLPYKWHYLPSSQEAPKSFQEASRKLQKISGQKSLQFFVAILVEMMTAKRRLKINWPLKAKTKVKIQGK